jgi:hypothetical protein
LFLLALDLKLPLIHANVAPLRRAAPPKPPLYCLELLLPLSRAAPPKPPLYCLESLLPVN